MFSHIDWLIHLEHHKDLLREAQQESLARVAVSAYPPGKVEKKKVIDLNNEPTSTVNVCCTPSTS